MSAEANKEVARRIFEEAMNKRQFGKVAEFYAPEILFHRGAGPPQEMTRPGRAAAGNGRTPRASNPTRARKAQRGHGRTAMPSCAASSYEAFVSPPDPEAGEESLEEPFDAPLPVDAAEDAPLSASADVLTEALPSPSDGRGVLR